MADTPERKPIKVGVRENEGPPPGYRWTVEIFQVAYEEAMSFLNEAQYRHLAMQFRDLAKQDSATHSQTIDIRQVEEFWELRDKGGILARLNVRVFYFVHKSPHLIVIMGVIKKENDGATSMGDKVRMRRRMRHYLESLKPQQG